MPAQEKQQIGDGSDHYGQVARQMAGACKQIGLEASKQAAGSATGGLARAAAAAVKAGVEGGRPVAGMAVGTAMVGPWGAALSAAWNLRHALFKILVCLCLLCLLLVTLIVSLPTVVSNRVFGLDGNRPAAGATMMSAYTEMAGAVFDVVEEGYNSSLAYVGQLIREGGYDYELSMDALANYARASAEYDVSYILAAYSASMEQKGTDPDDMLGKLGRYAGDMFPVTSEEKEKEISIPVSYHTYKPVTVTVVTGQVQAGAAGGEPQYETAQKTYYLPDGLQSSDTAVAVDAYREVEVLLPVYSEGRITGTRAAVYYEAAGQETLQPGKEVIPYLECTIHPFDNAVIARAFGLDLCAPYSQFRLSCGEAIQDMADALKLTLYGVADDGQGPLDTLTDAEMAAFVNRQSCSAARKHILITALSLVGKVPYFWGGKSAAGWNDDWNTPRVVTAGGSVTTGTVRPYGLDCSGFCGWVFDTALGVTVGRSCNAQYGNTFEIAEAELLPGDLGFLAKDGGWGHVLVFAGYGEGGERMWVHSTSGQGVVFNTPAYEDTLSYRRFRTVDYEAGVSGSGGLYSLEVEVTHYCACAKCCGSNADGITASGKTAAQGMVAMSSYYPFGTQVMINGIMYTVEDRGGADIENNICRVDIFVPDHNEALRLGRYTTTAIIYRIGR